MTRLLFILLLATTYAACIDTDKTEAEEVCKQHKMHLKGIIGTVEICDSREEICKDIPEGLCEVRFRYAKMRFRLPPLSMGSMEMTSGMLHYWLLYFDGVSPKMLIHPPLPFDLPEAQMRHFTAQHCLEIPPNGCPATFHYLHKLRKLRTVRHVWVYVSDL